MPALDSSGRAATAPPLQRMGLGARDFLLRALSA